MTNAERIEQVIRRFNWGNYSIHDAEMGLADYPAEQHWPAALASAIASHIAGDLQEAQNEIGTVHEIATTAQAAGETIDPGRILDVLGWPV